MKRKHVDRQSRAERYLIAQMCLTLTVKYSAVEPDVLLPLAYINCISDRRCCCFFVGDVGGVGGGAEDIDGDQLV